MLRAVHAGAPPPSAIPHTLSDHVCIDFVNSRFADHTGSGAVYDRIALPEWQRWYAARCGIIVELPARATELRNLVALRALLRPLLEARRAPDDRSLSALNRVLTRPAQRLRLARAGRRYELVRDWKPGDWAAVMAATVAAYARLLASGELSRVRVCANPDCTYLFHDGSRNRSRRWCDVEACGNLVRVRAHRAR